jgi:hypothetical protein
MIKLRVEWHHKCPCCGTKLVVDFFDELADSAICPWCGCTCEPKANVLELKRYLDRAVKDNEAKANGAALTK